MGRGTPTGPPPTVTLLYPLLLGVLDLMITGGKRVN
jgi:hypothetical protein